MSHTKNCASHRHLLSDPPKPMPCDCRPTDATKLPELLPCPFCGGEAELSDGSHVDGDRVFCVQCGCMPSPPWSEIDDNRDEATRSIEVWNRRAQAGRTAAAVVTIAQGDASRITSENRREGTCSHGVSWAQECDTCWDEEHQEDEPAAPLATQETDAGLDKLIEDYAGACYRFREAKRIVLERIKTEEARPAAPVTREMIEAAQDTWARMAPAGDRDLAWEYAIAAALAKQPRDATSGEGR